MVPPMAVPEPATGPDVSAHVPMAAPPAPIAPDLAQRWAIDPKYVFLNHGSFGAVPRAVRQSWIAAQDRVEARPIELLGRRIRELLAPSRSRVGEFLGMRPGGFGFVTNATEGVNSVLRSIDFRAGDELLTTSHVYRAVAKAMQFRARQCGASYVEVPLPLPIAGPAQVLEAVTGGFTARTRLVVIDHVTSATGLVFPIADIVSACRQRGIEVLVDAAHVPGMLPVDVEALGATYWTGNLHKWCCAPKGTAVLWVSEGRARDIKPANVSHYLDEGLDVEFDWQGTRDMAAWMVAGDAIGFMSALGWDAVRRHNDQMARWVQRMLCDRWEVEPISPADGRMLGSMCTVPLPTEIRARFETALDFQEALYAQHRIEVPIIDFDGRWHARPSAQVYNRAAQYDLLAQAVIEYAAHA